MHLSDYSEGKLLDALGGLGPFAAESGHEVAFQIGDPGDDGSNINEPSGNGYARETHASWQKSGNQLSNQGEILYGEATGPWGDLDHAIVRNGSANILWISAIYSNLVLAVDLVNPLVIHTRQSHGYTTGQEVTLWRLLGSTEIVGNKYTITVVSPTSFSLDGVDGTSGVSAYTGSGYVARVLPVDSPSQPRIPDGALRMIVD